MMLELQQFNIDLVYVQGTNLKIADSLSEIMKKSHQIKKSSTKRKSSPNLKQSVTSKI